MPPLFAFVQPSLETVDRFGFHHVVWHLISLSQWTAGDNRVTYGADRLKLQTVDY